MAAHGMMEGRINRRLDDDFVARLGKGQHSHIEPTDHTRHKRHPFLGHLPLVASLQPSRNGLKIGFVLEMIAINRMLCPTDDGLPDEIRGLKVHVGDPHRKHIRVAKNLLSQVVFNAVSISTFDDFVKIIFHRFHCLKVQNCKKFSTS